MFKSNFCGFLLGAAPESLFISGYISMYNSLSKHRCDGKVKLGRGPYAISIAILSMHTGFQHPRTKYMLAPGLRKLTFLCGFSCGFAKWSIWTTCHITYNALNLGQNRFKKHHNMLLGSAIQTINLLWLQSSVIQHLFVKPHEKTHARKVKCLELSYTWS